jgi:hypothetical protein
MKLHKRESRALSSAVKELQQEWGFHRSYGLNQLLERWGHFVKRIESGYEGSIDEYTLELELRDSLERLVTRLPQDDADSVRSDLRAWDERLRFATRPAKRPLLPEGERPLHFWWGRIPLKLVGQLASDLREDDLV